MLKCPDDCLASSKLSRDGVLVSVVRPVVNPLEYLLVLVGGYMLDVADIALLGL